MKTYSILVGTLSNTRTLNSRGMSLVEVLLAVGLTGILGGATVQMVRFQLETQRRANVNNHFSDLRGTVVSAVTSQLAWDITKQNNSNMSCSRTQPNSCPSGQSVPIRLYNSVGAHLFGEDMLAPGFGFTSSGQPCRTLGQGSCLVKMEVHWMVICSGAVSCSYPEEVVSLKFSSTAEEMISLNVAKFSVTRLSRTNFASNQSPVVVCSAKGEFIYIGHGRTMNNTEGVAFPADSDGCVSLVALQGQRGPQGPVGATGARGPGGPRGPAGQVNPGPTPPTNPVNPPLTELEQNCSAYPRICDLYKKYENRMPERSGAIYWNSVYEDMLTRMSAAEAIVELEKQFAITSAGGYATIGVDENGRTWQQLNVWAEIAAKHGLRLDGQCIVGEGAACSAASALAAQEYGNRHAEFCAKPKVTCHFKN